MKNLLIKIFIFSTLLINCNLKNNLEVKQSKYFNNCSTKINHQETTKKLKASSYPSFKPQSFRTLSKMLVYGLVFSLPNWVNGQQSNLSPITYLENTNLYNIVVQGSNTAIDGINNDIIIAFTQEGSGGMSNSDGVIVNLNNNNTNSITWEKLVDSTLATSFSSLTRIGLNQNLACGYIDIIDSDPFTPTIHPDPLLLSFDNNGSFLYSNIIDVRLSNGSTLLGRDEKCKSIITTEDNNAFISIRRSGDDINDSIYVSKINSSDSNNIIVDYSFEFPNSINEPVPIAKLSNGKYTVGASGNGYIYFFLHNDEGSLNSSYKINVNNDSILHTLTGLNQGGLFGAISSSSGIEYFKVQNDFSGIYWVKEMPMSLSTSHSEGGLSSAETIPNSNIALSGTFPIGGGENVGFFSLIDSSTGNLLFDRAMDQPLPSTSFSNSIITSILAKNNSIWGIGSLSDPTLFTPTRLITVPLETDGTALLDCDNAFSDTTLSITTPSRNIESYIPIILNPQVTISPSVSIINANTLNSELLCCIGTPSPTINLGTPTPTSTANFTETNYISPARSLRFANDTIDENGIIVSYGDKVITESGGNFVFTAHTVIEQSSPIQYKYAFKMDTQINFLDKIEFSSSSSSSESQFSSSIATIADGFILCGSIEDGGDTKIHLTKLDNNMNIVKDNSIHDDITSTSRCNSIIALSDNNVALAGVNNDDTYIAIIDPSTLTIISDYSIRFPIPENFISSYATSIAELNDGTLVAAITNDFDENFMSLIGTSGINIYEISPGNAKTHSVIVLNDNNIAMTLIGNSGSGRGFEIVILDQSGSILNSWTLDGPSIDRFYFPRLSIRETPLNTLFLTGTMPGEVFDGTDGFFVEINRSTPEILHSRELDMTAFNMSVGFYLESGFIVDSLPIDNSIFLVINTYGQFDGARRRNLLNTNSQFGGSRRNLLQFIQNRSPKIFIVELDENRNTITECSDYFVPIATTILNTSLTSSPFNATIVNYNITNSNLTSEIFNDTITFQKECGSTDAPTATPTNAPSSSPTTPPTISPSSSPSVPPTLSPSLSPTPSPTPAPTPAPTPNPSNNPTPSPTPKPTTSPTPAPSPPPTPSPTPKPTKGPTPSPTPKPTKSPTPKPTIRPTLSPTPEPTIKSDNGGGGNGGGGDDECDTGDKILGAITFGAANDCLSGPEIALSLSLPALGCCCCCCCCFLCCCCCCILIQEDKKKKRKKGRNRVLRSADDQKQRLAIAYEKQLKAQEIAKLRSEQ